MATKGRRQSTQHASAHGGFSERWPVALVFAVALVLRLLFWQATPDSDWGYSVYYKGDAPTWLEYASALQDGRLFELGLPLRPPANAYLIAALWDGTRAGLPWLRFVWCFLGAAAVTLFFAAARRAFGLPVALVAGLWMVGSSGLLMLSTSLNNETPYLVLVAAVVAAWPRIRERSSTRALVLWSAANALACLFRVEHALFFGLLLVALAFSWTVGTDGRRDWRSGLRPGAIVLGTFALTLLPWHVTAWGALARFNNTPAALAPGIEQAFQQVEAATAHLQWEPGAQRQRRRLPTFVRRSAEDFVAATVLVRGGDRVRAEDLGVLEEAFGYFPEPLPSRPFVTFYGGLNFYLANHPDATGGFDRGPLEEPPPLAGGAGRYPLVMVQGLPPPQLAFQYLPHLKIINQGYEMGWRWIREHPGEFLALAGRKLSVFWGGAALGVTGYNLPLPSDGVRRAVDLTVPAAGPVGILWRLGLLALVAFGGFRARRNPELLPWVLWLGSRALIAVAFYGYARHGATAIPALALLAALAAVRRPEATTDEAPLRRRWLRGAVLAAGLLIAFEAIRWGRGPEVAIDGRAVRGGDPIPVEDHADRKIGIRRW